MPLAIGRNFTRGVYSLISAEAEKLAGLLSGFYLIHLDLDLSGFCAAAVRKLVPGITHKTLRRLDMVGIRLTPAVAVTSWNFVLTETFVNWSWAGWKLFASWGNGVAVWGIYWAFPALEELIFSVFNARSNLAPLTERIHFFHNLTSLHLDNLNMDERDFHDLLGSLRSIPYLRVLVLFINPLGDTARVRPIAQQALPQVEFRY